jgi:hypothetical protein
MFLGLSGSIRLFSDDKKNDARRRRNEKNDSETSSSGNTITLDDDNSNNSNDVYTTHGDNGVLSSGEYAIENDDTLTALTSSLNGDSGMGDECELVCVVISITTC